MDPLVRRVCATYAAYFALGHEVLEAPGGRLVREPRAPRIYDANLLTHASAADPSAVDALLAFLECEMGGLDHRHVLADPGTPPRLLARLALEGYRPRATLQMVLVEGAPLRGRKPVELAIRRVERDADWESLEGLWQQDMGEASLRQGRGALAPGTAAQMVLTKRLKQPELRFFMANLGARDVGYFSSWPGVDGLGMVEDLYTHPSVRRRGVARALIHHAVADARARGAAAVLIGADPTDTPMHLYARLGFAPVALTASWLRVPERA